MTTPPVSFDVQDGTRSPLHAAAVQDIQLAANILLGEAGRSVEEILESLDRRLNSMESKVDVMMAEIKECRLEGSITGVPHPLYGSFSSPHLRAAPTSATHFQDMHLTQEYIIERWNDSPLIMLFRRHTVIAEELVMADAVQRITVQPSQWSEFPMARKLRRGDQLNIDDLCYVHNDTGPQPPEARRGTQIKFFVETTHGISYGHCAALVRIAAYAEGGRRMFSLHAVWGDRIVCLPPGTVDVVYPPSLAERALAQTYAHRTQHPIIRRSSGIDCVEKNGIKWMTNEEIQWYTKEYNKQG